MGNLPPFDGVGDRLFAAADSLTLRDAGPPPVLVFGGNAAGLFAYVRGGGVVPSDVQVFDLDLSGSGTAVSVSELESRLAEVVGGNEVRDKVVTALGSGADVLGHGLVEFALSLGDLGRAVVAGWSESRPGLGPISPVVDLLDTIRESHPASVVLVGGLAEDERVIVWDSVLSWSRTAWSHDNRVLVVVELVSGYSGDPLGDEQAGSRLVNSIRSGVAGGRVEWTWLDPLSNDRVDEWLGSAEAEVLDALVAMSGRDDLAAARLWELWVSDGHVERVEGVWCRSDGPEPFIQSLDVILQERVGGLREAPWDRHDPRQMVESALELAALGGSTFSRSAVASEVVRDVPGVERADVEDLIDRLGEDDDDQWVVDTDGSSVEVGGERFWRYVFASPWLARTLKSSAEARGAVGINLVPTAVKADHLAEAADGLHGPHPLFEDWLFNLAVVAGNRQRLRFYERRRSAEADRRTLPARAYVYLSIPEPDPVTLDEQIDLISSLTTIRSLDLAAELGLKVCDDAVAIGSELQVARAEISTGRAFAWNDDRRRAIPILRAGTTRLGKLHSADPSSVVYQRDLAIGLKDLGVAVRAAGRPGEAVEPLERSVELREGLVGVDPSSVVYQRDLAIGLKELGVAVRAAGRPGEAVEPLERSVELYEGLVGVDPSSVVYQQELAIGLKDLGVAVRAAGRPGEAVEPLERSVELYEGLVGVDPSSVVYQRELAIGLKDLGVAVRAAGRPGEAVEPLERSVELLRGSGWC